MPIDRRPFIERHRYWILFAVTALLLLVLVTLAPQQMPLVPYKLVLPMIGALDFLWLDHAIWPFAQPEGYLAQAYATATGNGPDGEPDYKIAEGYMLAFLVACLRQAVLVCIGALAVSLGL
jgi:hypothetical protein